MQADKTVTYPITVATQVRSAHTVNEQSILLLFQAIAGFTEIAEMPRCRYEVIDPETRDTVDVVTVGSKLLHRWTCESSAPGKRENIDQRWRHQSIILFNLWITCSTKFNELCFTAAIVLRIPFLRSIDSILLIFFGDLSLTDLWCMTVHSCHVEDGSGTTFSILDDKGWETQAGRQTRRYTRTNRYNDIDFSCSIDRYLLDNLEYGPGPLQAQKEAHAFKFADKVRVQTTKGNRGQRSRG